MILKIIVSFVEVSNTFVKNESKKPEKKRIKVCTAGNETIQKIMNLAKNRTDDTAVSLIGLLAPLNLAQIKLKYHNNCLAQFYIYRACTSRVVITEPAVQHVVNYVETHKEECQF